MTLAIYGRLLFLWLLLAAVSRAPAQDEFLRGGDVSEIPQIEVDGGQYRYRGKAEAPFVLMRKAGWNFVRFRIWNDPKDGFCDKGHTLAMAKRAAAQGLRISLDFHYSDWWADPGKQFKPAAWKDLPFEELAKAVYEYTYDVVSAMVAQGTRPYMVQVGNEILGGMLWPDGRVNSDSPDQWQKLATLLRAGFQAVHDAQGSAPILTMIHLDRGGDNKKAVWWYDHVIAAGVKFDTIGLSYYPFWHGHLDDMRQNVNDLATRYGKDIYIVETGYPWTVDVGGRSNERVFAQKSKLEEGFPASPEGQADFLVRLEEIVKAIPGGHGKGLLYWAPTWISTPKHKLPYDNMALFDFDGNALPSVDALGRGHSR